MQKFVIAALIAAGVAFAGTSAGSAAPVNNAVLKQAETVNTPTVRVQYYYHHRHRCHGYYSHWHWC